LLKKAQEIIANKCGVLEEEQGMDNMTLQQYLNLYKQPLFEDSMDAIMTLSKVSQSLKKKKKEKKKKKRTGDAAGKKKEKEKEPNQAIASGEMA
jgi:hypothetical protein